ncbi:MAG: AlpA family phage regulatory protein, partial [Alphaproteobacteria bacterium]|nr:AlpA family phage regulatory protein [Alphaproteobacteria bacterium]
MTRRQRLRTQALLLGPWFAPIIKAFDEKGVTAEDLLAAMLFEFDPYGEDRFARLPEVEFLTGLTRSSIYRR